jgi:ABC-type lipoprotein release transport system permease subunit
MLYGVSPADVTVLASACLFILAASLLATWLPARRATRIDPVVALRYE